MTDSPTSSQLLTTKAQQLERLQAWLEDSKHRTYGKRDKRRFAVLSVDGTSCTMDISEAIDWISDVEESTYTLDEKWMTPAQFDKLPEFEGF